MLRTWTRRLAAIGLGTALAIGGAVVAAADITEPPGRCTGSATFAEGVGAPFSVSSTDLAPGDVLTVPLEDTVTWQGSVSGIPEGTEREISGFIKVDMPWLLPDVEIDSWDGLSRKASNSDVQDYSLPSFTPRGVELRVYGEHNESGALFCSGELNVKVEGGAFSSPFTYGSIALLAGSLGLAALASRAASLAMGAAAGFATMLFLATTMLFLGLVPLNSALITALPILGIPLGAVWGKLGVLAGAAAT